MRSKHTNKKTFFLVILLFVLSISIGYAYLSQALKINDVASIAKTTWDVHFENVIVNQDSTGESTPIIASDKTIVSLEVNFLNPGDFYEYTVDVVNSGSVDAMIETIDNNLTEEQAKYLEYTITYRDGIEIQKFDSLLAGKRDRIKVTIRLKDEGVLEDTNFTLETTITYKQSDSNAKKRELGGYSLIDELNASAVDDTDINFGAISSDTNGQGIYHLTKIETSTPIYYYRGNVDNNNVLFGNFCWKIIRSTETGGVKLIYNGEPNEGVCNAIGDETEIGKSVFHTAANSSLYVGYMINNSTDSTIKKVVDEWFSNNLFSYLDYLEDTPFYNERDSVAGSGFSVAFAPRVRIYGITASSTSMANAVLNTYIKLGATNRSDIFTISEELGNGLLTYPVGVITSDEIVMAGGKATSSADVAANDTFYLHTNSSYWRLSPVMMGANSLAISFKVDATGSLHATYVNESYGVRPVLSLKPETRYLEGNGTKENPFIITD